MEGKITHTPLPDGELREEYIRLRFNGKQKKLALGLRTVNFASGDYFISFIPSLNLTAYGDSPQEASHMLSEVVMKDYLEHLLELNEYGVVRELKGYGWVRKPFLAKQLRNMQFLDVESIKHTFDLPAETVIREQFVSA